MVDLQIDWVGSPNFYPQSGVEKLFATDHWMVGTLASTDRAFNGSRKASSTYGVGQQRVHQYVAEKDYPFSDGNTYANRHTISVEHEGGYLDSFGQRVTPSDAVIELSAHLHANIADRHHWGALRWMVNVFPHNHWVATACPGTLRTALMIGRANQLLGLTSAVIGVDSGSSNPLGWNASTWSTVQIQTLLMQLKYDLGPSGADGNYGLYTTKAVRKLEEDYHLSLDVGIAGPQVIAKLAQLTGVSSPATVIKTPVPGPKAPRYPLPAGYYFGPEGGPVQSVSGYHGYRANLQQYQQRMHDRGWPIIVDGLYGPRGAIEPRGNTADITYQFQKEKGLKADKLIGPETWAAAWTKPIT